MVLAPEGQQPLPSRNTLAECGVVDGTVLQLMPLPSEEKPEPEPELVDFEEFKETEDRADLKRRAGFPLQRTALALPDAPPVGERMGAAWRAFWSKDAMPAPTVGGAVAR